MAKEKWDPNTQISVRCIHGDLAYYPSAEVQVGIDGVLKPVRVALIPETPVDLLIGVNDFSSGNLPTSDSHNVMVMTRQQKRHQAAANNPQEGYTAIFFFKQGLLYRRWVPKRKERRNIQV